MAIGSKAIISTDKHWINRPETAWSNTYEIRTTEGEAITDEQAKLILAALVAAERLMHLAPVHFSGARMAKYVAKTIYPVPDENEPPYDPTNTVPYITDAYGARGVPGGDGVMPKDVIWWMNRAGSHGRVGTLEFRGCLPDGDVLDTDGDWTLVDPAIYADLATDFAAALLAIEVTYNVEFVLMGEPLVAATYVMVGKKKIMTTGVYGDTYEIPIKEYKSRGVRSDRAKKRWYNRV